MAGELVFLLVLSHGSGPGDDRDVIRADVDLQVQDVVLQVLDSLALRCALDHQLVVVCRAGVKRHAEVPAENARGLMEVEVVVSRGCKKLVVDGRAGTPRRFPGAQGTRQAQVTVGSPRPVHWSCDVLGHNGSSSVDEEPRRVMVLVYVTEFSFPTRVAATRAILRLVSVEAARNIFQVLSPDDSADTWHVVCADVVLVVAVVWDVVVFTRCERQGRAVQMQQKQQKRHDLTSQ